MSKPVLFPAALAGLMLHSCYLYAASGGKNDTVPSNPLGQLITTGTAAMVSSAAATISVMTVVADTILDDKMFDTWAGKPRVGTIEKSEG